MLGCSNRRLRHATSEVEVLSRDREHTTLTRRAPTFLIRFVDLGRIPNVRWGAKYTVGFNGRSWPVTGHPPPRQAADDPIHLLLIGECKRFTAGGVDNRDLLIPGRRVEIDPHLIR